MTTYLRDLVLGGVAPGRYRLAMPLPVWVLYDELAAVGWTMRVADGAKMADRASMFDEFAAALDLPEFFGHNWDAFADCLRDLSWLPPVPTVLLWQRSGAFAAADRPDWRSAGRVIDVAIAGRVASDLPALYVLYPAVAGETVSGAAARLLRPVR